MVRERLELLRQVALVPYVSDSVKARAKQALASMNRYPLADDAMMLPEMPGAEL